MDGFDGMMTALECTNSSRCLSSPILVVEASLTGAFGDDVSGGGVDWSCRAGLHLPVMPIVYTSGGLHMWHNFCVYCDLWLFSSAKLEVRFLWPCV